MIKRENTVSVCVVDGWLCLKNHETTAGFVENTDTMYILILPLSGKNNYCTSLSAMRFVFVASFALKDHFNLF